MKQLLSIILLFGLGFLTAQSQGKFQYHKVAKGETLYGIAAQYQISVDEIRSLNPDTKLKLKEGTVLILPAVNKLKSKPVYQKSHTVAASETWYGISKLYGVSVETLQNANPNLGGAPVLREGLVLNIPENNITTSPKEPGSDSTYQGMVFHKVASGETLYGLSKKYNISMLQLQEWNPTVLESGLKFGQWLVVKAGGAKEVMASDEASLVKEASTDLAKDVAAKPLEPTANEPIQEETYRLYKLGQGEDLSTIAMAFGTTSDDLVQLNPELRDGLVAGRYIIVPINKGVQTEENKQETQKETLSKPRDTGAFKALVILPFTDFVDDTTEVYEFGNSSAEKMRLRAAMFYSGLQLAYDSLTSSGQKIQLAVYDSENRESKLREILQDTFSMQAQYSIGPLYANNVLSLSRQAAHLPMRIISPLSGQLAIKDEKNIVDLVSSDEASDQKALEYIEKHFDGAQVLLIYGAQDVEMQKRMADISAQLKKRSGGWVKEIKLDPAQPGLTKAKIEEAFEGHETGTRLILSALKSTKTITGLAKSLDAMSVKPAWISLYEWPHLQHVEGKIMEALKLAGPKKYFAPENDKAVERFQEAYKARFGREPELYAFQGYDALMFAVLYHQALQTGLNDTLVYKGLQTDIKVSLDLKKSVQNLDIRWQEMGDKRWKKVD